MNTFSIFTGGEQASLNTIKHFIKDLSIVIAADSGLETVDKLNLEPKLIIGDMDSLKNKNLLEKYSKVKMEIFSAEKDFSDTELAFRYAQKQKAESVSVFGGGGGRTDHLIYFLRLFDEPKPPVIWLSKSNLCFCLGTDCKKRNLKVRLYKSDVLSVFPAGKKQKYKIISQGLYWELSSVDWSKCASLSNKAENDKDSTISLSVEQGRFLIFLSPVRKYEFELK